MDLQKITEQLIIQNVLTIWSMYIKSQLNFRTVPTAVSTALCILLYNSVSTYVGLYGSGLFIFGSYVSLPTLFACYYDQTHVVTTE